MGNRGQLHRTEGQYAQQVVFNYFRQSGGRWRGICKKNPRPPHGSQLVKIRWENAELHSVKAVFRCAGGTAGQFKNTTNGQADYFLAETDIDRLKEALETCPFLPKEMRGVLLQYVSEAEGKIESVKEKIALWYDDAMDRVGGSFKKHSQRWILLIATVLVAFTNADSLRIVSYLYDNPTARKAIANQAALYVRDSAVANRNSRASNAPIPS